MRRGFNTRTWEVVIDPSTSAAVVGTVRSERQFGAVRAARKLYWRQLKGQEWAVRVRRPAPGEGRAGP
jgi:hypothetical protein